MSKDLGRKSIHRLEHAVEGLRVLGHEFLEVGQRLVAKGSQAGRHDEHGTLILLVDSDLSRRDDLIPRCHPRIRNAHEAFSDGDSQAECHA
jgi:hypothetical protein